MDKALLVQVSGTDPNEDAPRKIKALTVIEAVAFATRGLGDPVGFSVEPGKVVATYRNIDSTTFEVVGVVVQP